jgi:DNA topoisomerase-1
MAAAALGELASFASAAEAKRNVRAAIARVAARLGNTATICRKCYVHPEVLAAYHDRSLGLGIEGERREEGGGLEPEEVAVLALLRARLKAAAEAQRARAVAGRSAPPANGHAHAAA